MQAAKLRKLGYVALTTALATLLIVGFLSLWEWRRYDTEFAASAESRHILTLHQELIDLMRDVETSQRGFLLTGNPAYLELYHNASQKLPATMSELIRVEAPAHDPGDRMRQLRALINDKMTELRQTIELYRSQGSAAALAVVQTDLGKRTMDRIREVSQQMQDAENARSLDLRNRLRTDARDIRIAIVLATMLLAGLVAGGGIAMRTATRQTERSRELLRATLYGIGDAVIATDTLGAVQMMNSVAEQLTGVPETEARGKPIEEVFRIVNEATRARVENPVRRVLREGKVVGLANHTVLISKTGQEIPIDDSGAPVAAPGGPASGVVLVFRDVSERKKAMGTARRLAAIVENSDDAIIGKTLQGVVTSWNHGAERLFGYTAEEMIGRPIARLIPSDRAQDMEKILSRIAAGESVDHYETRRLTKDGRQIDVSLTVSPIRDDEGMVVGASKIARDVTQQRALEESLRQTQKMEAVGRLAGGVAHDFNNLLTVILGYSSAMSNSVQPNSALAKMAAEIQDAATQAAAVTGQLLAFSRKQITQPRVLDLSQAVMEMRNILQRLIGEDIDLTVVLEESPCPIVADPNQLSQVLLNLAANARDAMPTGGKLTIETRKVMREQQDLGRQGVRPAGPYSALIVTDNGSGMDPETQAHIFEPFFTTKDSGKGTGLGLATVYGIVQQHGGWVDVYSERNHGTTFRAYFPIAGDVPVPKAAGGDAAGANERKRTGTILLVEDQAAIRMLAEDVLLDAGHKVLTAVNGRLALEAAAKFEGKIDLLITDVVMPELSGPELASKLTLARPNLLVLYISGFTDHALFHSGAIERGTAFLQKPFLPAELLAKVDSLWRSDLGARA